MLHRRNFIKHTLLTSLAAGTWPLSHFGSLPAARAQDGGRMPQIVPLAPGLSLITGIGENLLVAQHPEEEGLLLVDGGQRGREAALLESLEANFGTHHIQTLINTHWHPEQTGLNGVVGEQGGEIIAHENTRLWLSTKARVRWQDKVYDPLPAPARPNTTFYDTHDLHFGGELLRCGHLVQAHTDGDIYVHFTERDLLAVGGVLSSNGWPVIDWSTAGWIGGMVQALDALAEIAGPETLIIPANGSPIDRPELLAQAAMFRDIMGKLKVMMESGYGVADVLAAEPTAGLKPEWGSPDLFLELAFRSFWGHVRQFDLV